MKVRGSRAWMQRTFKVDIVLVFSSLIIGTMLVITSFTYFQNQRETLRLANRIMTDTARSVIDRTIDYLRPAQHLARLGAEIMSDERAEAGFGTGLERFFLRAITEYPQIGLIYWADGAGNFFQVRREFGDGTLTSRVIDRTVEPPVEIFQHRDADGEIARRVINDDVSYDPRLRPWYEGASGGNTIYWTDIYVFNTGRVPGITAAFPATDAKSGALAGIIAADLTLAQLSIFLEGLQISQRGLAFVMDDQGRLVAFPGISPVKEEADGGVRPLLASEISDPRVAAAARAFADGGREFFEFEHEGETVLAFVKAFPEEFQKAWNTVVLVPVDDFLGPIKRNSLLTLALSAMMLALSVALGLIFSRNIARPVEQLTEELNQIRDFRLGSSIEVRSYIREIQDMVAAINSMKAGLEAFGKYVPADLVRDLVASGEEVVPGGKERELTLMFSDIENFVPISEEMTAGETMICLSEYFDLLSSAVSAQDGTIDKYIGDSMMAFWGAPHDDHDHARHACLAVLRGMAALETLNARRIAEGAIPFITRFGVHTGSTVVGNVGSRERLNYTAIGDSVNLASRLENVNRYYRTNAIISDSTWQRVRDDFVCRPLDLIIVKGRTAGVQIYELLAEAGDEADPAVLDLAKRFGDGFERYLARDWEAALAIFEALSADFPYDNPSVLYVERCRGLIAEPPSDDWDGLWRIADATFSAAGDQ